MNKKFVVMFVALIAVFFASAAFADFKDGLWEITTQVSLQGMPQQMPPTTIRQCIDKKDPVVKNQDKNYDCKTSSFKVSGSKVSYVIQCEGREGTMKTSGQNTYTGNTMQGSATTQFKMKGQPAMQMNSKMKGKYIGPCPK